MFFIYIFFSYLIYYCFGENNIPKLLLEIDLLWGDKSLIDIGF